jgi:N-acetylmuramoyl-L-alanine amidase
MPRYLPNSLTRLGLILLIPLLLWAIPGHAAPSKDKSVTKSYSLAQARYHALEFSPALAKDRQNWLLCVKAFDRAYRLDPYHPSAPNTLLNQGDIYLQMYKRFGNQDDLNKALSLYDDIVTHFPHHSLADDALFRTAMIQAQEQKDVNGATLTLAKLLAVYPHGDMVTQARAEMRKLKSAEPQARPPQINEPAKESAKEPAGGNPTQESAKESAQVAATPSTDTAPETGKEANSRPAEVVSLRHWSTENYTRVVIETTAPVPYKGHLLKKNEASQKRLYVDLGKCLINRKLRQAIPIKDGLLQQMRSAQFNQETVRVVLDTLTLDNYKIFNLDNPFRIIVDVKGTACAQAKLPSPAQPAAPAPETTTQPVGNTKTASQPPSSPPPPSPSVCKNPSLAQQLGLGIKRVVIDPGHGGKDPGAIGIGGLREKDVVLTVAKKVARKIASRMGIEVILTRKTDVFIPLEERTAIANTKGGDLFISIHANAAKSPQAHGIETYYLDLAGTEEDRGLAAVENASSSRQISDLQNILQSLMQNSKKDESARLAATMQDNLVSGLVRSYPDIANHGIKTAPFIVLIGAQMPSILTEIAFISNPMEAQRLQDDKYLEALADHITDGVVKYAASLTMARL